MCLYRESIPITRNVDFADILHLEGGNMLTASSSYKKDFPINPKNLTKKVFKNYTSWWTNKNMLFFFGDLRHFNGKVMAKIGLQPAKSSPVGTTTLKTAYFTLHIAPAPGPVHFILLTSHCTLHTIPLYCMLHLYHFTLQTVRSCPSQKLLISV